MASLLLAGCNGSSGSGDNSSNLPVNNISNGGLIIEKSAVIPVINGKSTFAGVYVHNNSDVTLSNIRYETKSTNVDAGITLTNTTKCTSLAPHASCLLSFFTPSEANSRGGSSMLFANYNGNISQQLINYEYVDSSTVEGVRFSGNISLYGSNDYATVYAFAGKGRSYHQVGFASDDQSLGVNNGLMTDGYVDIAANQVIPLELKSSYAITTTLAHVVIFSSTEDASKEISKAVKIETKQGLQSDQSIIALTVQLVPQQQANLIVSNAAIMNFKTESTQIITIMNNGNIAATNVSIPGVSDAGAVNIIANNCNSTIAPSSSCTFTVSLTKLYDNGSDMVNISYNNGIQDTSISQQIVYYYSGDLPMVNIIPDNNYMFSEQIGSSNSFNIYATNGGNVPLSQMTKLIRSSLTNYSLEDSAVGTSSCNGKTSLNVAGTCLATLVVNASNGTLADSGSIYMKISGSFNGNNYSFVSKPITANIEVNNNILSVVGINPANSSISVARSTAIQISFNKSTKVSTINTATVKLYKSSDSSQVTLTLQGYSSDGKTFTFVTPNNNLLAANTAYSLVINPSQIQDSSGASLNRSVTSQTITTFTTGTAVGPQITSYQPANGAYTSTNSQLFVTFSKDMQPSTLNNSNVTLYNVTDNTNVTASLSYNNDNSHYMLSVAPSATLPAGKTYQLLLNESQITDTNGNLLGSGTREIMQFYVDNTVGPIVVSSSPANGATGVNLSTNSVTLTFSQSMDISTINTTSVQLYNQNNVSVSLSTPTASNNNTVFTFPISGALESGLGYYLNLTTGASGIKDTNSNQLVLTTLTTIGGLNISASNASNPAIQFMTSQKIKGFMITGNYSNASVFNISDYSSTSARFANFKSAYKSAAIANDGSYLLAGFTSNSNPQLLRSTDSGTSWGATYATTNAGLLNGFSSRIVCLANTSICVVGSGDPRALPRNHGINKTTNNGLSWYTASINEDSSIVSIKYDILGGSCTSNGTCVFAGKASTDDKGIYLVSTNRGDSWSSHIIPLATSGFNDVDCNLDNNSCVMVGSSGKIYYLSGLANLSTNNGANAWQVVSSPTSSNLSGVRCNFNGICVAVGDSNTILNSTNFGQSWSSATTIPSGSQHYNSVEYDSVNNRFVVVGNSGWIIYSTNSNGSSWDISSEISGSIDVVSINCSNGKCIAGAQVTYGDKTNYTAAPIWVYDGLSWTNKAATANSVYNDVYSAYCAKNGTYCLQGMTNGYLNIGTISSGVISWESKNTVTNSTIRGVTCNSVNCIVVYSSGKPRYIAVGNVTNSSNAWTATSTSYALSAITCINNSTTCLAVGESGVYRSSNSGSSWSAIASGATQTINALSCNINESSQTCVAVGTNGQLIKTKDGGLNWAASTPFASDATMSAISCNINMCVAGGARNNLSVIYRSIDGGNSWTMLDVNGFGGGISSLSCADGFCLAFGYFKDVANPYSSIISYDNGYSWQDINIYYTDANMRAITPFY